MTVPALLRWELITLISREVERAEAGHCLRIDNLASDDVELLAPELSAAVETADVHVLATQQLRSFDISVDRAVELRNRKLRPLVLLVPAHKGRAASSLDNSFKRIAVLDLLSEAAGRLEQRLDAPDVVGAVRSLRALLQRRRRRSVEGWATFLSVVAETPSLATVGRELWRVGLIPDKGPTELEDRLPKNLNAVDALARPAKVAASVAERLGNAGVRDGPMRHRLQIFLETEATPLSDVSRWARLLGDTRDGDLTFERWPLVEAVASDLQRLAIVPFVKADGTIDAACKLRTGPDGQAVCEVAEDAPGIVVVQWETEPRRTSAVAHWLLDLVPPADSRLDDGAALGTMKVKGDKRRATFRVDVGEDDLGEGVRFVVRLRALDENGDDVQLEDGALADVDTDEFEVLLTEEVSRKARNVSSGSIPEAVLRAAADGLDNPAEDLTWDLGGAVLRLRLDKRRVAQVRVSPLIVGLQERIERERQPAAFMATGSLGVPLGPEDIQARPLELPQAVTEKRERFLAALESRRPRHVIEAVSWDTELADLATAYISSYRRALDAATTPEAAQALLAAGTLTVAVSTHAGVVRGVVVLPVHPLRVAWVMAHDRVLRAMAEELADVVGVVARKALVDLNLVARVVPANYPFVVLDDGGRPTVYTEELTHGAALYLPFEEPEPEAAAEALCSVLGVRREGANLRSQAAQISERIAAYRSAHPGGLALKGLGINPGAGELWARALEPHLGLDLKEPEANANTVRVELVAYSDRAAYAQPLRPLQDLQHRLRISLREEGASHLLPALSLSLRPTARVVEDADGAHLALVQDIAEGQVAVTGSLPDRSASFGGLLTSTTTKQITLDDGSVQWETTPSLRSGPSDTAGIDLPTVHRSHQQAVSRVFSPAAGMSCVRAGLKADVLAQLRTTHDRADWVITLDRYLGLDLYENAGANGLGSSYLLDYAPDFVEGIGQRLTVTTSHRDEVVRVLAKAMGSLGLAAVGGTATIILDTLAVVSGRLALRLLFKTSYAREAVSLAALMTHLREAGSLADQVVIPVDAHPEIFGVAARSEGERAQRCDLLLARLGKRSFKLECVEVKSRQEAALPTALADLIVDQLKDTESLLQSRFFATDPPRVDGDLQRARFASLLHHYADRAVLHGLVGEDAIDDVHRAIDRAEEQRLNPEISLKGYVIALDREGGFPASHRGVPIEVLTAADLGRLGFTTTVEVEERSRADFEVAAPPSPASGRSDELAPRPAVAPQGGAAASSRGGVESGTAEEPAEPESGREVGGELADQGSPPEIPSRDDNHQTVDVVLGSDQHGRDVVWHVSTKGSPHAFIIGIPGQGKSVTTRRVIRSCAEQGLPSLVFDFHGDMAADPPANAAVLDASAGLPFSPFELPGDGGSGVNTASWEIAEIVAYVCGLGEIQRNHVYRGLVEAYREAGWNVTAAGSRLPSIEEFAACVEAVEVGSKGKHARDRLRPLTDFGLFGTGTADGFDPRKGGGVVVDVSSLGLEAVQLGAGAFLLRKIYRDMFRWGQGSVMRLAVVLDEAHRLARDVTLPKLMKEGRKYGVSVVVASQGINDFHRDVLGNAGVKVVFRTNFPSSKTVAGYLRGRTGQDLSQQIEQLGVGEAYVATPDDAQARRVYMFE